MSRHDDIPLTHERIASTRRRVQRLAWLYDSSIRLPGGYRIGIEPLVGLIPGIGDALGLLMGGQILYESARLGIPRSVLMKMIGNVALDSLLGAIPLVGDLFDFAFKANVRNLRLLETHLDSLERPSDRRAEQRARGVAAIAVLAVLAVLSLAVVGLWSLIAG